jgi:hypothetical protein
MERKQKLLYLAQTNSCKTIILIWTSGRISTESYGFNRGHGTKIAFNPLVVPKLTFVLLSRQAEKEKTFGLLSKFRLNKNPLMV